jgi:hypothetical protein
MNLKSNLKKIVKIANKLDQLNYFESANELTKMAVKLAQSFDEEYDKYEMRTQRDYDKSLEERNTPVLDSDPSISDLGNDPLMVRYKMEYKKDPINGYDEDLSMMVDEKLKNAVSGTSYSDLLQSIDNGDSFYILEPWLKDEMSLEDAFADYLEDDEYDDDDDGDIPADFGY